MNQRERSLADLALIRRMEEKLTKAKTRGRIIMLNRTDTEEFARLADKWNHRPRGNYNTFSKSLFDKWLTRAMQNFSRTVAEKIT